MNESGPRPAPLRFSTTSRAGPIAPRRARARDRRVAADHHLGERALGHAADRRLPGYAAGAQHDDAIADLQDFRKLVGDEHDRFALGAPSAQNRQQLADFAWGEIGGRFVEDQQFRVAQDRLEDFDALAAAEPQLADARVRVEFEPEAAARIVDALSDLGAFEHAAGRAPAQHDILEHAHRFDQHEVLMDHRDAGGHRLRRPVAGERPAAKADRPCVRRRHAEQHFHQRALARAVLAEQADDLAFRDIEIDAVVGAHGAEAPHDPSHFDQRRHSRLCFSDRAAIDQVLRL